MNFAMKRVIIFLSWSNRVVVIMFLLRENFFSYIFSKTPRVERASDSERTKPKRASDSERTMRTSERERRAIASGTSE